MASEFPSSTPTPPHPLTSSLSSDSGIITPSLALASFTTYFNKPNAPLRGAIVSVYQGGGVCSANNMVFRHSGLNSFLTRRK